MDKTSQIKKKLYQRSYSFLLSLLAYVLLFLVTGFTLEQRLEGKLPAGVHAWAQADRYALSAQFYDRGTGINEAYTYYMGSKNGRVGVEFPVVPWLSAKICKGLHQDSSSLPVIFRWLNWLFLFSGISAVTLVLIPRGSNGMRPVWLGLFLIASPVALFYGFGFIPDAAAAGLIFWGAAMLFCYTNNQRTQYAVASLLFLGIASLVKITSGIYLVASWMTICYVIWKTPKRVKWMPYGLFSIVFFTMLLGVVMYDYYWVHKINIDYYAPVFMSKINPVRSFDEWRNVFKAMRFWDQEYFTPPQYIFAAFTLLISGIRTGRKLRKQLRSEVFIFTSLLLTGILFWSILFGKQLPDHDYYFLGSFYPWLIIMMLLESRSIMNRDGCIGGLLWLFLGLYAFSMGATQFEKRQNDHYVNGFTTVDNHVDWLKRIDLPQDLIQKDELIFVFYEFEPNLSLVYFDRKGMVFNHEEMARKTDHIDYWGKRLQPGYVVLRNIWISNLENDQGPLFSELEKVYETNDFTIYRSPIKWTLKP